MCTMNRKKFCTTLLLWKSIGFSSQLSLVSPLAAAVTSVPISSSCVSLSLNVQQNFKCLNLWSLKLKTSSFAQLYLLTAVTTTEIVTFYKIGINWRMLRLVKLFVEFIKVQWCAKKFRIPNEVKLDTGGPPLTRFSLQWIPLPWFLAYVCESGVFTH